eukprot:Gb_15602 [translate_table: standard]
MLSQKGRRSRKEIMEGTERVALMVVLVMINIRGVLSLSADNVGTSTQPLIAGPASGTIPALPVQSEAESCQLDLSDELFGGVKEACGGDEIDRSRCCPVVAAWLYAAHARTALTQTPSPSPSSLSSSLSSSYDLPLLPDDSQTCANTLQSALRGRGVEIPQPNVSCDPILCFCGIRLHQISSLNCPEAPFGSRSIHKNSTATSTVRALESNCKNPSYEGCSRCLKVLEKLNQSREKEAELTERTGIMYSRDCQLMGLTWLLAKNKTAYIPTVSAVLRALMYSDRPQSSHCSPDKENMPLAVDSTQLNESPSALPNIVTAFHIGFVLCSLTLLFFV